MEKAASGDTVMLKPGTYKFHDMVYPIESYDPNSGYTQKTFDRLVIMSQKGAASTTIDAERQGRHFMIGINENMSVDSTFQFVGLTFRGGRSNDRGGSFVIESYSQHSGGGFNQSITARPKFKDCIFVDNGLLRLNEGDQVMDTFKDRFGIKVKRANAGNQFLKDLKGKKDPEHKRKAIGKTFIDVFLKEAKKNKKIKWLAQGTIYPDVIESAGTKNGTAHVIKSHHNVGGLPSYLNLPVIEPLKDLFKDEVRKIGLELGLPKEILFRHPFPGPGLGVRILGEIKRPYIKTLQLADDIFISELIKEGYYDKVSQAFAVFLPVKSVGVVGDSRRYEYVISLRAVETIDFMTAKSAKLPHSFLEKVSNRIINEIPEVSRVTYDISSKPPATIEWE